VTDEIENLRVKLTEIKKNPGGYRAFAKNAGLGESWVYKFAEGLISRPGRPMIAILRRALAELETQPKDE
jgi:hypothetical protein